MDGRFGGAGHQLVDARFAGDVVVEVTGVVEAVEGKFEELSVLAADAQRPAVLAEAETVELGLLLGGCGDAQEDAEGADE